MRNSLAPAQRFGPAQERRIGACLACMVGASAVVLFACAAARHMLLRSTALDLGWFDQALFLISRGEQPIVSFAGFHILGDHAAWILYPLALLYVIHPSVYWLFGVQAAGLAAGAVPAYALARQHGLDRHASLALASAYLLHPLVFNVNLFDFHPETLAPALLLSAALAARSGAIGWFAVTLVVLTGCKEVVSITMAAMGLWLALFESRHLPPPLDIRCCQMGWLALAVGLAWLAVATQVIIPHFSGRDVAAVGRYQYLGDSLAAIVRRALLDPQIVALHLFTLQNSEYLALLLVPVAWGLSLAHLAPLLAALPMAVLNLLSTLPAQKDLIHQYSLPILPFLMLAVVMSVAGGRSWVRAPRWIAACALVAFLALAKFGYFGSIYLSALDTWQATREALAQVAPASRILTTAEIAPQLTHRRVVGLAIEGLDVTTVANYDQILLNVRHPGWASTRTLAERLVAQLRSDPRCALVYARDDVYLFNRVTGTPFRAAIPR